MQILVRHIHKNLKGREELDEWVLDDDVITVGHGSDQSIQLRDPAVAQRHLELRPSADGRFRFRTVGGSVLVFDSVSRASGTLKHGDRLELGEQAIAVVKPEAGFDAVLEVMTVEQEHQVGPATHHRVNLTQTGLSVRPAAWFLLAVVFILFLGLPLAGYFWSGIGSELRQNPLLPSDHVWSSGPLANVHHTPEIGNDCQSCHLQLFERTPDRGCLDCHAEVTGHVTQENVSVPGLDAMRCATCHQEHYEPSELVRDDSGLCTDCHREPELRAVVVGDHRLPNAVSGFSAAAHPGFRLATLRQQPENGEWHIERSLQSTAVIAESSNLKFPHELHLDPDKVESLRTGQPLDCGSCHLLAADKEHFEAVTMEGACQDCHALSFDDDFPRKQLPHGDVEAVLVALEEHYIRKHADPQLRAEDGGRGRRRPGIAESAERCEGSALECGRQQALEEAINQFSRSGCVTCHEVSSDSLRPFINRWNVSEVKLTDDWYPYARFDHEVHLVRSQNQLDNKAACDSCHAAQTSDSSEDILIPGIENCLQCHGQNKQQETRVTLNCRGCHDFHLPFRGMMKSLDASVDIRASFPVNRKIAQINRGYHHD